MATFANKYNVKTNNFEILEPGRYTLELTEIAESIGKKYQSEEEEVRLKWKFQTIKERNSENEAFTVFFFTRTIFTTHEKNKLNKVIKGLFGKQLSVEEFNKIDSDELIGKRVDVLVENNERPDGRVFTNITTFIGPPKPQAAKKNVFKAAQVTLQQLEAKKQQEYSYTEEDSQVIAAAETMQPAAVGTVEAVEDTEMDWEDAPF